MAMVTRALEIYTWKFSIEKNMGLRFAFIMIFRGGSRELLNRRIFRSDSIDDLYL